MILWWLSFRSKLSFLLFGELRYLRIIFSEKSSISIEFKGEKVAAEIWIEVTFWDQPRFPGYHSRIHHYIRARSGSSEFMVGLPEFPGKTPPSSDDLTAALVEFANQKH